MKAHSDDNCPLKIDFDFEAESARDCHAATSAGTFPLRRARYFSETGTPLLSAQQRRELTNLVNEVDPEMKHMMIVQNLRIVVSIAKRYTNRGMELVDLVRVGNQGLIQALEAIESGGGLRFSTYIVKSVCQNIERAIVSQNQNNLTDALQDSSVPDISFDNLIH
jgi:DNA-directed RNA polymerase sigma subunit (sigma70/sigma32)